LTVAFACIYLLPGDPARLILGSHASAATIATFRQRNGLDESLPLQYVRFLERVARFDFGDSLAQRRPVGPLIGERVAVTARLVALSAVLVFLIGMVVPLALRLTSGARWRHWFQGTWALLGVTPPYVLGTIALLVFGAWLGWVRVLFAPEVPSSWILPALTLAAYPIAVIARLFDRRLEDALVSLYALRARALGVSPAALLLREALPNALPAALGALANSLAVFITGTFFVEVIFGVPGLGRLSFDAIRSKDLALLAPICMLFAVSIITTSATLEWALTVADPARRNGA
jgi:ABC-type dipeptide/oligopeptide/nickel transport system permease component